MPPVVFEPTISAGEQPKTALDREATETGRSYNSTGIEPNKLFLKNACYFWVPALTFPMVFSATLSQHVLRP
jgi:hypothetical protein